MSSSPFPTTAWRPLPTVANPIVQEWLEKAAGDMDTASREIVVVSGANYDAVCFHSQQAIEKLLKSVLISKGKLPAFTHDLGALARELSMVVPAWTWSSKDLRVLTLGAVQYRYPGLAASRQDGLDALDVAQRMWPTLTALL